MLIVPLLLPTRCLCAHLNRLIGFVRAPALLSAEANDGTTPAHLAACFGHSEILSLLGDLDPGSLMLKDQLGNTPAHDATRRNCMPAILVLIERCPSLIYVANTEGLRPIDLAEREEMRRFLKDAEKRSMVPAVQLQTLARDNRALAAQNAVLNLYARNTWQSGAGARAAALVDAATVLRVAADSPEYAVMQAEFSRTMSKVWPQPWHLPPSPPQPPSCTLSHTHKAVHSDPPSVCQPARVRARLSAPPPHSSNPPITIPAPPPASP
jgi:hypothetical protein